MAADSSSSSSSFASSALARPSNAAWTPTPTSDLSTVSAPSPGSPPGPQASLRPLDLGPPAYQATITLFHNTPQERTVFLGPWEVVGSRQRRVRWQCSYHYELLEHYLPSDVPSDIHPHTLHSRHRQYNDPAEMEQFVTFTEPHRVRYTADDGVCIHDSLIWVRYEFTTLEASLQFQGDLRKKDMVNYFDVDVAWTNVHSLTNGYGAIRGFAAVQRLKMWRDGYTTFHSISLWANKTYECRYREYDVHLFEGQLRDRDDRTNQVRLDVCPRRGSAPDETLQRLSHLVQRVRPRQPSAGHTDRANPAEPPSPFVDIRFLYIRFSSGQDYQRFLQAWLYAHSSDQHFRGLPFPARHVELPSDQMQAHELPAHRILDNVPEPDDRDRGG